MISKLLLILLFCSTIVLLGCSEYKCTILTNLTIENISNITSDEVITYFYSDEYPVVSRIEVIGFKGQNYLTRIYTNPKPNSIKFTFGKNEARHTFYFNQTGLESKQANIQYINVLNYTINWSCS